MGYSPIISGSEFGSTLSTLQTNQGQVILPRIIVTDISRLPKLYEQLGQKHYLPRLYIFETNIDNNQIRNFFNTDTEKKKNNIVIVSMVPAVNQTANKSTDSNHNLTHPVTELRQIEDVPSDGNHPVVTSDTNISRTKNKPIPAESAIPVNSSRSKENTRQLPPAVAFRILTGIDVETYYEETYLRYRRRVSRRFWRQLLDTFRAHPDWTFEEICTGLDLDKQKNKDRFQYRFSGLAAEFTGESRSHTSPVQYLSALCNELMPNEIIELPGADFLTPAQLRLLNYLLDITNEEDLLDLTYSTIKNELGYAGESKVKEAIEVIAKTVQHPEDLNTPRAIFLKATGIDLGQPDQKSLDELIGNITDEVIKYRLNQFIAAFSVLPNGSYDDLAEYFDTPIKSGRDWMNSILDFLGKKSKSIQRSPYEYIKQETGLDYLDFFMKFFTDKALFGYFPYDQQDILRSFADLGSDASFGLVAQIMKRDRSMVKYYLTKAIRRYVELSDSKSAPVEKVPKPVESIFSQVGRTPIQILRIPKISKILGSDDIICLKLLSERGGENLTLYGLGKKFNPPLTYSAVVRMIRRISILVNRELNGSQK